MTLETPLFSMEVPAKGATKGHVRFGLRTGDPDAVGAAMLCATVASAILFERLQAHWTHLVLVVGNDAPQLDALARWEDDGLDLTWKPKTLEPGRMEEIAGRIRDKAFLIGKNVPKAEPVAKTTVAPAPAEPNAPSDAERERAPEGLADHELTPEEEDYLVKQLLRVP